ncbi:MAG: GIY-YIG nuclease family protein [Smithella sp.]
MQPATIKLFLAHGEPNGLRTAEISNWNGKAIACPRNKLIDLFAREEIQKAGIYCLTGTDPDSGYPALYIGEAESVGKRLKNHSDKDYWVHVVAFVSKDENLTKAHIKYIEGKLIERATEAGKAKLQNSTSSGAKLPEPDTAEMDVYLEKVYQLLPILGVDLFSSVSASTIDEKIVLFCKIKGLKAKGKRTSNGFLVFKGSQAILEHRPSSTWAKKRREELIEQGILLKENNYYIFTKDVEFTSPSTAGAMVRGGATNGLIAWKTADGKSLKELEQDVKI